MLRVSKFLADIGHPIPSEPTPASRERLTLWVRLLMEEACELAQAAGVQISVAYLDPMGGAELFKNMGFQTNPVAIPDLVGIADGCADVSVINTGMMALNGIADLPLQEEVDANNQLKVATGTICPTTGKLIKAKDHPKPDIAGCLRRQPR
jgi:predicted HAD superfamily Cof-like phosphohydrolase